MTAPTTFRTAAAFRRWLGRHHATATHLVVRCFRVHATDQGLGYAEALDEALCYGWIDGVRRAVDADTFSVRFSPRKATSIWSRVNVRHAERLIQAGRMAPYGHRVFDARDCSRTGSYSFEQARVRLAAAFTRTFKANRKAWKYFECEAPWYRRTSIHWVMSAQKEETRVRRFGILIACSASGERIPMLRRP